MILSARLHVRYGVTISLSLCDNNVIPGRDGRVCRHDAVVWAIKSCVIVMEIYSMNGYN